MALTPNVLKTAARCFALLVLLPLLTMTFLDAGGSQTGALVLSYLLVCAALMAFPWIRRTDIVASVSVLLLGLELASYTARPAAQWPGFAFAAIGAFAAMLPTYIRDFRSLAVRNEHMRISDWRAMDRRSRAKRATSMATEPVLQIGASQPPAREQS